MSNIMDLPTIDLINIRKNQIQQHRVNFHALQSQYEIMQHLLPPPDPSMIKKTIDDMRTEKQAVEILLRRVAELEKMQIDPAEKQSITA